MTLREARERAALSLAELAALANVTVATLWRHEHGHLGQPWPKTRRRIAQALGLEPSAIRWQPANGVSSATVTASENCIARR